MIPNLKHERVYIIVDAPCTAIQTTVMLIARLGYEIDKVYVFAMGTAAPVLK